MYSVITTPYGGNDISGRFNADLSQWNTSYVTSMGGMFKSASNFNSDLAQWDISHVRYQYDRDVPTCI